MAEFEVERQVELLQVRNRLRELRGRIFSHRQPIGGIEFVVTGRGLGPERVPKSGWRPFAIGNLWGGFDETTWFRMHVVVPKEFKGHTVVALIRCAGDEFSRDGLVQLSAPGEAMVFVNGSPFQGLDINREELFLLQKSRGGEALTIEIEAVPSVRMQAYHRFKCADLAIFHREPWDLYWDCEVPIKVYEAVEKNSASARQMLEAVSIAIRMVDLQTTNPRDFYHACRNASRYLKVELKRFPADPSNGKLVLSGHSHIDTAWLWPLRETRRKVGRTFSTALNMMSLYPEFHFSFSQPELYLYCKEHFPELYARIKKRVKEGRWEICGAPWIEPDSNMAGAEALVRQFLYGNRFFRKEFGVHTRTAWLPDAFGFPWSLPQIMRKCQVDTFVTTKIDWSTYTRFPYSMFNWQGVDGTKIFAVMPPLNYNGNPTPNDCIEQWKLFKQKHLANEIPFPFGWGDGGGGPTMEQVEHGKRLENIHGVPRTVFGGNEGSLESMRLQSANQELPIYNNELYLELHRGCQTTQARTKRNNRKAEVALREAEIASTLAMRYGNAYPVEALWNLWRTVLTNQFHDILPGSSITEVYTTADLDYFGAIANAQALRDKALTSLVAQIDTQGPGSAIVVFNTLSWDRIGLVEVETILPKGRFHVVNSDGQVILSQKTHDGKLLVEATVPAFGHAVFFVVAGFKAGGDSGRLAASRTMLENKFLSIKFDNHGRFVSIYDLVHKREVLPKGERGNVLQFFEDRPHLHDAWDIDHNFYKEKKWEPCAAHKIQLLEEGPLRAIVRFHRRNRKSVFVEDLVMDAVQHRVDVHLQVDWHEKRTLLKVAFPVEILATRATFDIQWATIERTTHDSTEFDRARFEVPAHYWADLSEGDYGVSLLNDCKYGYDVRGNTLRLSLLRSSIDPDPHADEGRHNMKYALYPHKGDWRCGSVKQGYEFNNELLAVATQSHSGAKATLTAFLKVDRDNIIVETLKKAEDSQAVVVRVYEAHGQRNSATFTFSRKPKRIFEIDMMEDNPKIVNFKAREMDLFFLPYEIKTLRVEF